MGSLSGNRTGSRGISSELHLVSFWSLNRLLTVNAIPPLWAIVIEPPDPTLQTFPQDNIETLPSIAL